MPAVRLSSRRGSAVARRRSSLATSFAKPGTYGYAASSPPPSAGGVTFAPNVTPTSYTLPSRSPSPSPLFELPVPIFPPSETPAPPPTRKRQPAGKRRSQGYIPRPPNAFMLFRADFVRQKHVPGTIETNHGSLSKIIGNCWRSLPLPEKHIWETKAKHAKAEHKLKYPDYKFRPVHNKQRGTAAGAAAASTAASSSSASASQRAASGTIKGQLSAAEDERRCEEVAQLLLQGKKGQELASAVKDLDERRHPTLFLPRQHEQDEYMQHPDDAKYPHPHLTLDPLAYYPHMASSPPTTSTLSGAPSPYTLPTPLEQQNHHQYAHEQWRLQHRRSSSVPLPERPSLGETFNFPPNLNLGGLTLPPLAHYGGEAYLPPPPPSSADDSLAGGAGMAIAGGHAHANARMSFGLGTSGLSHAHPDANNASAYIRPSFSFGFGAGSRESFTSYGGLFGAGGVYSHVGGMGIGRRASSAQAFFSPTTMRQFHEQQQMEEELPDADTSLFESGYLNTFGAPSAVQAPVSPTMESVGPLDPTATVLHAPQPVHPVPVEFAHAYHGQQPFDANYPVVPVMPVPSPPTTEYASFELDTELGSFKSRIPSISMESGASAGSFEEIPYSREFV